MEMRPGSVVLYGRRTLIETEEVQMVYKEKILSTSTGGKEVTKRDCAVSIFGSSQDPAGSSLRNRV